MKGIKMERGLEATSGVFVSCTGSLVQEGIKGVIR